MINSDDVEQARQYSLGNNPPTPAGGPTGPVVTAAEETDGLVAAPAALDRAVSVLPTTGCAGFTADVVIALNSPGDYVAGQFTINFDPAKLTIRDPATDVTLRAGLPAGTALTLNTGQLALGRLGILIDSPVPFAASAALPSELVNIRFAVPAGTAAGAAQVGFSSLPTIRFWSDRDLTTVTPQPSYSEGQVTIGGTGCTTAAEVTVSGHVAVPNGAGLRGATVILTDAAGNRRTVLTSSAGFFSFENVPAGETYVISIASRRFRFGSRVLHVTDNLANVDFIAQE